jgi:uncharacterized protein YdeI (YjbR/CyaY-like superfamily)
MPTQLETLDIRTRGQWREWLAKHHMSSRGIWLVFYKRHAGVKSILYEDAVRQALCFGWIDSLIKRLDDDRYAIKVTPRKPTSKWSAANRRRWAELKASGLLAQAGFAARPTKNTYAPKPTIPELPRYIMRAIKAEPKAWHFFKTLPARERRNFVVWIHIAKRPDTRERRLRESIDLLVAQKRLGLK